jgi:hypothetical protein
VAAAAAEVMMLACVRAMLSFKIWFRNNISDMQRNGRYSLAPSEPEGSKRAAGA